MILFGLMWLFGTIYLNKYRAYLRKEYVKLLKIGTRWLGIATVTFLFLTIILNFVVVFIN